MNLFGNKSRIVQKGELRNVEVELVSLLFDEMNPANQKGFVVKNASGKSFEHKINSAKFKSETSGTQGRLYVTLMEPNIHDSQGDYYTKEEIQKSCDHFAKHGLVGKCDVNHNMQPVPEITVVENYILKTTDKEHFPDAKVGAWVQVLKCENLQSELWQKVEKGEFNGVSIYGRADDYSGTEASLTEIKNELGSLRKVAELNNNSEMQKGIAAITERITELEKSSGTVIVSEAIKSIEKSLKDLSVTMSRAISKSIPGEPDVNLQNVDKEVMIDGNKVIVKASHREIYKGIADVDSGKAMNILTANTTSLFIDEVVGSQPGDTLSDISVIPLLKDEKIDVGLIDDLVFKNSLDGALTAQGVSTADLSVPTGILNAEFTLGRDVVEFYKDKYGEQAFGAYVEQHIAKKTEKAMRLLLFKGDRASGTDKLKALNGIIKLATAASDVTDIDSSVQVTYAERFEAALLAFGDEMLEEQESFKFYVSQKDLIRIRSELSKRQTGVGDRLLLEGGNVSFAGIPVKARLMPDNYIVAGLTKFIIIGYRTDAELKVEHHGADWKYHWYIRIRPGITYIPNFIKIFKVI
ncbi:MAG: XkdF-like putative serine protease domain-containing protein [Candidatus Cloacimonadaceae bacterium]|nr:XkdF-like putative serine protease domain-containing protein [Candidatus Cloacimonadaceae bacterium]